MNDRQPALPLDEPIEPITFAELGMLYDEVAEARASQRELEQAVKAARARTHEAAEALFNAHARVRITNERARMQLVNRALANRDVHADEKRPEK